jgi:hypothetical protein
MKAKCIKLEKQREKERWVLLLSVGSYKSSSFQRACNMWSWFIAWSTQPSSIKSGRTVQWSKREEKFKFQKVSTDDDDDDVDEVSCLLLIVCLLMSLLSSICYISALVEEEEGEEEEEVWEEFWNFWRRGFFKRVFVLYITSLQESERGVPSLMIYQCPFPSPPPPTHPPNF